MRFWFNNQEIDLWLWGCLALIAIGRIITNAS